MHTAKQAPPTLYESLRQQRLARPILISGKRTGAVFFPAEDWSASHKTLYLLAVPGMRAIKEPT